LNVKQHIEIGGQKFNLATKNYTRAERAVEEQRPNVVRLMTSIPDLI